MPHEPLLQQQFDENSADFKVRMLAERVAVLTKEKEQIEDDYRQLNKRVLDIEKAHQRGAGIVLLLPFVGAAIGVALGYGKAILKPWLGGTP